MASPFEHLAQEDWYRNSIVCLAKIDKHPDVLCVSVVTQNAMRDCRISSAKSCLCIVESPEFSVGILCLNSSKYYTLKKSTKHKGQSNRSKVVYVLTSFPFGDQMNYGVVP